MEILVQISDLVQVLSLDLYKNIYDSQGCQDNNTHLKPGRAHTASLLTVLLEQQLVNDYVVGVDSTFRQLLDQSFRFVK